MAHLWVGAPSPPEWDELQLVRRLGWSLSELRALPVQDVRNIAVMMGAEARLKALYVQ